MSIGKSAVIGVFAAGLLVLNLRQNPDFQPYQDGVTTQGTVTKITRHRSRSSYWCTVTEVRFSVDGTEYSISGPPVSQQDLEYGQLLGERIGRLLGDKDRLCNLTGRTVEVSYQPADPQSARAIIDSATNTHRLVIGFSIVLLLYAVGSIVRSVFSD